MTRHAKRMTHAPFPTEGKRIAFPTEDTAPYCASTLTVLAVQTPSPTDPGSLCATTPNDHASPPKTFDASAIRDATPNRNHSRRAPQAHMVGMRVPGAT